MKILYLTPAWYGFKEVIFDGESKVSGLPSFILPLKGLIDAGHEINFVVIYTDQEVPKLNIGVDWLNESMFKSFCHYDLRMPHKIFSIIKYRRVIRQLMLREGYDFVYAHGTSTAVARSVVTDLGVPFGQRLYGTFLWSKIQSLGYLTAIFRHLVEYFSFARAKKFLLVTNDGSRGDLVWAKMFPKGVSPYEFYYWKNGVARVDVLDDELSALKKSLKFEKFIFYCARFDDWKRQDRVLKILYQMKLRGKIVGCYFAGPFDTLGDRYYNHVRELADELGILDQIVFMGGVDKRMIFMMSKLAVASLSLYDVCNLTNVFHEMMSAGALIIVKDDEPIKEYIVDRENGFLVNSDLDVVAVLEEILDAPRKYDFMRLNVLNTSLVMTKSWPERVEDEVRLIAKFVDTK